MCLCIVELITFTIAASVLDFPEPVTPVTRTIPRSASASFEISAEACSVSTVGIVNGITRITIMKLERCRRIFTRNRPMPAAPQEQS